MDTGGPSDDRRERVRRQAREYLERYPFEDERDLKVVLRKKVAELEETERGLDPSDPLFEATDRELERIRAEYDDVPEEDLDLKRSVLEVVAEEFVAEDFWLDTEILRAVSTMLHGQRSPTLTIGDLRLLPETDLSGEKLISASKRVRERARKELREMDEY